MSTILDALKKSEQERKMNSLPRLSDMPAPQEPSPWPKRVIFAVVIALLIAVIILGTLWLSSANRDIEAGQPVIELSNDSISDQTDTNSLNVIEDASDERQLVVNVVSFSDDENQRFVMINGKMYRQGEFISAGLKVDSIKKNSVILNQRGRRLERRP